jgi:hypothetical protein
MGKSRSFARAPAAAENDVKVLMSRDLQRDLGEWASKGYVPIGGAEFVARGSQGIGQEARAQADAVGASVVLFTLLPAKLKSIRRKSDGSIDLSSVMAYPPAYLSPRGYYVVTALFLA